LCFLFFVLFFFFFFQAEDGIRDHCVTGVQTCALPICADALAPRDRRHGGGGFFFAPPLGPGGGRFDGDGFGPPGAFDGTGEVVEIGRASCRERGEIWGGGVACKKKGDKDVKRRGWRKL